MSSPGAATRIYPRSVPKERLGMRQEPCAPSRQTCQSPKGNILAGGFISVHPNGQGQRGRAGKHELEERVAMQPEIISVPLGRFPAHAHTPQSQPCFSQGRDRSVQPSQSWLSPRKPAFTRKHTARCCCLRFSGFRLKLLFSFAPIPGLLSKRILFSSHTLSSEFILLLSSSIARIGHFWVTALQAFSS